MHCNKCNSSDYVKAGFVNGRQRYKCKKCSTFYCVEQKSTGVAKDKKLLGIKMYQEGLGVNSIGRLLGVSHVSVIKWIKNNDKSPAFKKDATPAVSDEKNSGKISFKKNSLSKFMGLYKTLNPAEKKQFTDYIESPFFNSDVEMIQLNQYMFNAFTADEKNAPDEIEIPAELFGNGNNSDKKIKENTDALDRRLEEFISLLKYKKSKPVQNGFLLSELRERKSDNRFMRSSNEFSRQLEKKRIYDSDYFYYSYLHEKELDNFFMKGEVRKSNESLQRKSDHLDTFYLSEKLKSLCEMINRKNIISAEYNLNMLDELRTYVSNNIKHFQTIPAVFIYYKILLTLLEGDNPKHFKELKQSLDKRYKVFSKDEALQMYLYLQNYCIKKINSGHLEYFMEIFSIYETLLESEVIFEENYLSQWDYKNIVTVGIKLKKFGWTREFIEKYKVRIAPAFRENAYEFNLAVYYYSNKEYKNALKLLRAVEFTDVFYHLDAKSILLKIYFEMEEVESFYSLVDAFKIYLIRNKNISVYQRGGYQNLVKYTKQAFDLKLGGASVSSSKYQQAITKLKKRIEVNKGDANLSWLMEKLQDL